MREKLLACLLGTLIFVPSVWLFERWAWWAFKRRIARLEARLKANGGEA